MQKMAEKKEKKQVKSFEDSFLTVRAAADKLQISEFTLRRYLRDGKIKAFKRFAKWYIYISDLNEFITTQPATE
jgi:excisionase family DNA binding protein